MFVLLLTRHLRRMLCAGMLSALPLFVLAATPAENTAALHSWLDARYEEELAFSPERLTQLGRKEHYGELSDYSPAADARYLSWYRDTVRELEQRFDYEHLDATGKLSWDLWRYRLSRLEEELDFREQQYIFTQMTAPHAQFPQLLINEHDVDTAADLAAYLQRLLGMEKAMDQLLARAEHAAGEGIRPPRFAYDIVIEQAGSVISGEPFDDSGEPSALWQDVRNKIAALEQTGVLSAAGASAQRALASEALRGPVRDAYERLLAWLQQDREHAPTPAVGVHALPRGDAFYAERLRYNTTTAMSADQIHELGLAEVDRIQSQMREIMAAVDFEGSLDEFFDFVRSDERFYYPDTAAGRSGYIAETEAFLDAMEERLGEAFGILPRMPLEVRRVEAFRERAGGAAHYRQGTADGSRPGIYYLHMSDMSALNTTDLQTTAYHEGNPGHHMQIAIALEREDLPTFRRQLWYSAFGEGWALYAERVAGDMGLFEDPYYDFGRLTAELFRAIRLVVDTGLHSKGWSQEQAVQYMLENSALPEAKVRSEIRRYLVLPGQATSYKVGMLKILALRERAREALGDEFELAAFHDAVLAGGSLPLTLLERRIDGWINEQQPAD